MSASIEPPWLSPLRNWETVRRDNSFLQGPAELAHKAVDESADRDAGQGTGRQSDPKASSRENESQGS